MTAAADAVAASAANLDIPARRRWDACAVGLLAVTRLTTPSRQAIAGTAFALASSAADLKRNKEETNGECNGVRTKACNLSNRPCKHRCRARSKVRLPYNFRANLLKVTIKREHGSYAR